MSVKPKQALLMVLLFAVSVLAFNWYFNDRADRKRHRQAIDEAKKSFLSQASLQHAPIDSIYAVDDSISFYRNDSLIGKAIVTTE
jgi:hypothetical protein